MADLFFQYIFFPFVDGDMMIWPKAGEKAELAHGGSHLLGRMELNLREG